MNDDLASLLIILAISLTVNAGLLIGWLRVNKRLRWYKKREQQEFEPEDRNLHLERTIEALASQVDQLASGQEFLSRVITERAERDVRPIPRLRPEVTPH